MAPWEIDSHKNRITQTKPKKKLGCCQRCWHRFMRCIKVKCLGMPEPIVNVQSKLQLKATDSIRQIFQNAVQNLQRRDSKGNTMFSEIVVGELKRKYSIKGSKEKILNNMIKDYKAGKLSLTQFQDRDIDVSNLDKNQVHALLKEYEASQGQKYAELNSKDLKKQFQVNKSQEKALDSMVDDLKKGKLSSTDFDPNDLDQRKINDMLQKYQARPSFVAKKFSIKGSQEKILRNFLQDYKKGKMSATKFTGQNGFNPNRLNKKQLNDMLNNYDAEKKVSQPHLGDNGLQQLLQGIEKHPSIIDLAKKKFLNM